MPVIEAWAQALELAGAFVQDVGEVSIRRFDAVLDPVDARHARPCYCHAP